LSIFVIDFGSFGLSEGRFPMVTPSTAITPSGAAVQPRRLRIFISYASEDAALAESIANGLRDALGDFAEINFDRWSLIAGEEFKKQLAAKLAQSDILVIVYTGNKKQSHGFTGWEVGFFEGVMRASPEPKRIIPVYLDAPPDTVSAYEGIGLNIPRELLQMTVDAFAARKDITAEEPMCRLIEELQDRVDSYRQAAGFEKTKNRVQPEQVFHRIRVNIFRYLKTTVDVVQQPQKQITIKCAGTSFRENEADLPKQARILPIGVGTMAIFGLPDDETTWDKFLNCISGPQKEAWRDAITSVVMSSLRGMNIDNSQIILSSDESSTYRLILSSATKFFDNSREFNLFFVEALNRQEYGDRNTTLLLKGLELVCRYRFMFLERDSKFSADNLLITRPERLPDLAGELVRELNLMRKDSLNAGLDQPAVWANFVDWSNIHEMAREYEPAEETIRGLIDKLLEPGTTAEALKALQQQLSDAVRQLAIATEPQNTLLIKAMAQKLQSLISQPEPPNAG
jgi:hypothetical protein